MMSCASRSHLLRGSVVFSFLLLGAESPFPGGCGSNVSSSSTVTENCDTIVNGNPPAGCGSTVNEACDTIVNGKLPQGCADAPGQASPLCPSGYPLGCGNSKCCETAFPICCANSNWCGTTADACKQQVDNPGGPPGWNSDGGSSGGGNGGGGGGCTAAWDCSAIGTTATLRTGCCALTPGCSNGGSYGNCSDGCGNGWYEFGGQVYGPCSAGDSSCLQQAAMAVVNACLGR